MGSGFQGEREAAFRSIYDTTRQQLLAYALRRTRNQEDAADVVADVYLIAWRRFDSVPSDERALLWLYATARRVLANRARRTETRTRVIEGLRLQVETVSMTVAEHEGSLAARHALQELSDDDREILMLAGWEGLSSPELACVLGCSVTAVRLRLHRARLRLRTAMAEVETQAEAEAARDLGDSISTVKKA